MRLQDQNDYTTLTWVKPEIDETLKLARQGLEDYVENGQDPAQLELCSNGLAQVHGALRMVELYGAAMVAEEMHALAKALIAGGIEDRDNAFSALMRGIVQLPDYLERLQTGFRDIPLVLLPLLNDLRGARGEKSVSEAMLFSPNLGVELPASARGPSAPLPLDQVKRRAEVASQLFQGSLLKWLKDGDAGSARDLADVCLQMVEFTSAESARRLFWVASALLDAAARGAFPVERSLQQAIARIEREIKRLAIEGDAAFRTQPPVELTRQLLYFIAHAPEKSGRLGEVNAAFALESYMPSEREVEHARSAMAGHNRALLSTVTNAIKEDLLRVKDALDLHMRAPAGVVAELGAQIDTLDRVKETLGVLGLGVPQRVVRDQLATMHAIAGGHRAPDESALLDIAGALLYVEAMLDDQVARLGEGEVDANAPQPLLPAAEARAVLDVVAREALNNFSNARGCFVAFVETHWDHARLQDVSPLLSEVAGALRILEVPAAVDLLTAISRFTVEELIAKRRVPTGHQLDRLADALASVEYFLEAIRDRRPNPDQILNIARESLAAIGYWPLPAALAPAMAPATPAAPAFEPPITEVTAESVVPVDPALVAAIEVPAPAFAEPAAPVPSVPAPRFDVAAAVDTPAPAPAVVDAPAPTPAAPAAKPAAAVVGERLPGYDVAANEDVDAEIQEVFLEEFSEEIDNLDTLLKSWGAKLDNVDALRPIRRVFHTLKGSGRLVGAKALGEFSWKIENMLNRVLDGTRPPTQAVYDIVAESARVLPDLRAALAGEERYADLDGLKAIADRVAAGEEAHYVAPAAHAPEPELPIEATAPTIEPAPAVPVAVEPPPLPDVPEPSPYVPVVRTASHWPMLPAYEAVPEAVSFALDPVLLEILRPEVEGHLEVVDEWLARSEAQGPQRVEERLLRSVHTMNGAFAMTEVSAITGVTSPLEGFLKRLISAQALPSAEDVVLVRQATCAVRQTLDALADPEARLPQFPALAAALQAVRDALPEPGSPVLSLGDDDMIVAVDMGGIDTAEVPRFDAPSEPLAETTTADAGVEFAPADAEDPERLTLDSFLEAPLPVAFDIAEEAPIAAALPPVDDRAEEAAYAAELAALQALADAEAAAAAEQAARAQAERDARVAAEAAMALAIAEAAAAEAAAAESAAAAEAAAAEAEAAAAAEAQAAERAAQDAEAAALAAELAAFEQAEREARAAAELRAREQSEREAAAFAQMQAELAEQAARAQAEQEAREAEAREAEAREAAEQAAREQAARDAEAEAQRLEAEREAEEARQVAERAERQRIAEEVARREAARLAAESPSDAVADAAATGLVLDAAAVPDAGDPADPDEVLDTTDIDTDLLEIFLEESNDLLDHSDGLMARLRDEHEDRELITGLQRDLHTLKGGARMAGVWAVGELGHAMESLLEAVADGKRSLDARGVIVLERCFDRLHAMTTRVTERKAIVQPNGLIAQVNALALGQPLPGAVAGDADAGTPSAAVPVAVDARKPKLAELSRPIDDVLDDDDGGALRAAQEQVRIRADLLDKLVTYAGEVAIYRARLEQQLGAFRGNLNELEQTTSRIRDQLRRLEIETEAQIASRYQREEETSKQFDPLEFDRFSTQQQLTRSLAESTNDLGNLYDSLDELTRGYEALLLQQSRVSSDLQEGLMRTRMLPFESLVPRLRRVLRQACTDTGKQAQLKVDGASGEMDRSVLDRMTAPIEHMLRNAIAHGLETPEERRQAKKDAEGTVRIAVAREGSEVVLRLTDDGKGLDRERIFAKAVERGLTTADAQLSDEQVFGFILESGFSTAETVSKLAGRGVGMDVVYSEIRQLGGSLQIRSTPGKGSEFTVRLPFTLAVTQAVFVKIGETRFAVPIASVQGVARIGRQELSEQEATGSPVFRYAGEDYGIYDLGRLVGHAPANAEGSLQMPLLLARSGDLRAAICVDQVLGSKEIVVKPVGPQVSSVTGIFGATIMGDGSVVVILDVAPLARRFNAITAEAIAEDRPVTPVAAPLAERKVPFVMVVDDSITMRKVTGRVLERHNFEVGTAKDGVDAIEKMAERVPDLMLLDIEMPRMDGYELAQTMRGDARLRDVPIIMITSRTGDKHRQRAFEIGVNRYLGKPYQEPELIRHVFELLAEVAARG
ncbi:response regulator [Silanimonas sp.]|jgi:chemosensory pili system protein ChpA (sensor histidine kinase/response regulator)|uniref:hybrid sensor histidine kinase/response regulator n=1 Tax=Silanimonas sp. TaxID=1929290 RepID=UPI0037C5F4BD